MAWPWLDERQLIAVAQHYGGEPEVQLRTWLLDITWDPYVALFFASYGWAKPAGNAADWKCRGRVSAIDLPELKRVLPDRHYVDIIRAPGFSRIRNQRALFIDAPDPSIVDDYSPWRTEFYQKPGLVFTDLGMSVTEDFLLSKDPSRGMGLWEVMAEPGAVTPRLGLSVRRRPVTPSFKEIATTRLIDTAVYRDAESNSDRDMIIQLLCAAYAKMRNDTSISHVAINSLHDSVGLALVSLPGGELDIPHIMRVYVTRSRPSEHVHVRRWIHWASELWDKRGSSDWLLSVGLAAAPPRETKRTQA